MTKLVYIGGYGRSGSTLLESLFTTRPDILACGEVVSCLRDRVDRGCTCGVSRQDCDVWGAFYKTENGLRGLTHEALTLALLHNAACEYALLVDSSKTAWGSLGSPFKLHRALSERFHLLHVVRNPRGVCWSNAGGTRKGRGVVKHPFVRHLRTAVGWWAANLSCEAFGRRHPERYTRVRYEDLTQSHAEMLQKLFATLLPGAEAPALPRGCGNRHQLYGNQNRYKDVTPEDIHEDVRWKSQMPRGQQGFVAALTWPLRLRYGY